MPSLSPKDRAPLCLFSYQDHRRCRTPRIATHPHFCFYHAQKESQSQATEKLAKDLTYFFSGDYLSANDLNTALGRLIPAVVRGELKPRVARTVAYMLQTLMQSTRLAQHEYINAFSTDAWRNTIATSVNSNHAHLYPPKPKVNPRTQKSARPSTPVGAGLVYAEPRSARPASSAAPAHPTPTQPPSPPQHSHSEKPPTPPPQRPSPADTEAALAAARSIFPPAPNSSQTKPAPSPTNPAAQPNNATPAPPPPQPPTPPRDPFELHFPHTALRVDGKRW